MMLVIRPFVSEYVVELAELIWETDWFLTGWLSFWQHPRLLSGYWLNLATDFCVVGFLDLEDGKTTSSGRPCVSK